MPVYLRPKLFLFEIEDARKARGWAIQQMVVLAFKVFIEERDEIGVDRQCGLASGRGRICYQVSGAEAGVLCFANQKPDGVLSRLVEKGQIRVAGVGHA